MCDQNIPISYGEFFAGVLSNTTTWVGSKCKVLQNLDAYMHMLWWTIGYTLLNKIRNEDICKYFRVVIIEDKSREKCFQFSHVQRRHKVHTLQELE